jgi:hypothetical protein
MAPPTPRILLLGGHGNVSLLMTPKILSRSWNLTSIIRKPDQKSDILEAGKNGPGKLDVLVESIEDVKSDDDAKKILDKVKPDWVIWSAGMFTPLYCLLWDCCRHTPMVIWDNRSRRKRRSLPNQRHRQRGMHPLHPLLDSNSLHHEIPPRLRALHPSWTRKLVRRRLLCFNVKSQYRSHASIL